MIVWQRDEGWYIRTWSGSHVPVTWFYTWRAALGWVRYGWSQFIGRRD